MRPRDRRQLCKALQEIETDLAAELIASWRLRSQDEFVETLDLLIKLNNLSTKFAGRLRKPVMIEISEEGRGSTHKLRYDPESDKPISELSDWEVLARDILTRNQAES